jgi:uncharacterized protein YggE
MRLTLHLINAFIFAAASSPPASAQATILKAGPSEVATSGSGVATLAPQRATVRVGVSTHAVSAAEASAQNAALMESVRDTLVRRGFVRDSLQTIAHRVAPEYDYANGRRLIDYAANTAIRVSVPDLDRLGEIIYAALRAGATEISELSFQSDGTDASRHEALMTAFAKARGDARAVATAAGAALGRLLQVTTQDNGTDQGGTAYEIDISRARSDLDIPTYVAPRELKVKVTVHARWELVRSQSVGTIPPTCWLLIPATVLNGPGSPCSPGMRLMGSAP